MVLIPLQEVKAQHVQANVNLCRALHRTLEEAGLEQMGVHALRHPYVKLTTKVSTRTNHESYT